VLFGSKDSCVVSEFFWLMSVFLTLFRVVGIFAQKSRFFCGGLGYFSDFPIFWGGFQTALEI